MLDECINPHIEGLVGYLGGKANELKALNKARDYQKLFEVLHNAAGEVDRLNTAMDAKITVLQLQAIGLLRHNDMTGLVPR